MHTGTHVAKDKKMQNFLERFCSEIAKFSGRGVGWEGLGGRWCEIDKPRGYAPRMGLCQKLGPSMHTGTHVAEYGKTWLAV